MKKGLWTEDAHGPACYCYKPTSCKRAVVEKEGLWQKALIWKSKDGALRLHDNDASMAAAKIKKRERKSRCAFRVSRETLHQAAETHLRMSQG